MSNRAKHRYGAVIAVTVGLAVPLTACTDSAEPAATPIESVNEDDFFADDGQVGTSVTVTAPVHRVLTPTSFVLAGHAYGDPTLLVLSQQPLPWLVKGQRVEAAGTVREFDLREYRRDHAVTRPAAFDPFHDEEVLVSTKVSRVGGDWG